MFQIFSVWHCGSVYIEDKQHLTISEIIWKNKSQLNEPRAILKKSKEINRLQRLVMIRYMFQFFLSQVLMVKISWNWLPQRETWSHLTKSISLECWLSLTLSPCKKTKYIKWFFSFLLLFSKYFNLIGWDTQLSISKSKK